MNVTGLFLFEVFNRTNDRPASASSKGGFRRRKYREIERLTSGREL